MNLRISGKHMEIGDAFRSRIEGRIGEAIDKYFDGGFSGHVTVEKSGSRFSADCMIHLDTGMSLQATGEAQDPIVGLRRCRGPLRKAASALQAPAEGASCQRRRSRAGRHRLHGDGGGCRRRRGSAGGLCAGDRRRIDDDAEDHVGRLAPSSNSIPRTVPVFRVPQCRKRPRQHRLSPAGRQYRLDRPVARPSTA